MKTGIICFWDRYATPYLSKYERLLEQQGVHYEVIFWNRLSTPRNTTVIKDENVICINKFCRKGKLKLLSFFAWRKECLKILNQNRYDNLIILSTVPAILLWTYLLLHYKGRYIFDIRDYTMESNYIFRKLVMKLVRNSCLTPISSKGFLRWLEPSNKIIVNHNITVGNHTEFNPPEFSGDKSINLSFVGNVRLDTQTRAMLISLGNNDRIQQHYFGRVLPTCDIEQVIKDRKLTNVVIHGPFDCADKKVIYCNTDLINTVYVNSETEDSISLGDSTPLPNRLYDALMFYRPLVASKGTYLAELVDKYDLGININGFDKNIEQQILNYTNSFDKIKFQNGCDKLREEVMLEEDIFIKEITRIFNYWK